MALQAHKFVESDREEWDSFVNRHPKGRFSQLIGYKDTIEKTFGYESSYWLFRSPDGKIKAIFPSFVKRSWLLGNKLVSQPFCEYGGLLGDDLTEEDNLVIKQNLSELLVQHRVPFLEVHGGIGLSQESNSQVFQEKPMHQYAVLRLSPSKDIWERRMQRKTRTDVHKAQRSGLECYQETTEKSITQEFYPLFLHWVKGFGTPPLPLSLFLNYLRYLPQYMRLFLVKYRGETIHALLGFTTGNRVHIISMPSDERHWDKNPSDLACWEFIKWAADNGYENFDFGPVRYKGASHWKRKWGAEFFDYSYFFLSRDGGYAKDVMMYSSKTRFLASLWRRLVPLPLTGSIGPWFRKQLGD